MIYGDKRPISATFRLLDVSGFHAPLRLLRLLVLGSFVLAGLVFFGFLLVAGVMELVGPIPGLSRLETAQGDKQRHEQRAKSHTPILLPLPGQPQIHVEEAQCGYRHAADGHRLPQFFSNAAGDPRKTRNISHAEACRQAADVRRVIDVESR